MRSPDTNVLEESSSGQTDRPELNQNFHAAPSLNELVQKLLAPEQLHVLEKYGITASSIEKAQTIAQEITSMPNTADGVTKKMERFQEKTRQFLNDKSNFPGRSQFFHDRVMNDKLAFVTINLSDGDFEKHVDIHATNEELTANPENFNKLKLHLQVPDHLVPFVGLLLGQAMKNRLIDDFEKKPEADVPLSWKIFAGFQGIHRADIARIVYYMPGKFTDSDKRTMRCFENTVQIFAPIAQAMDIGGLQQEAHEENDVVFPSFNTPLKVNGRIIPNLFFAMGHSHLRREMQRRGILGEVFDKSRNYAVPKGAELNDLAKYA